MVIRRFDVFRNPSPATTKAIPYFVVVQSELLDDFPTRVVIPLARATAIKGPSATLLNPELVVDNIRVVLLTQQIGSAPVRILRKHVAHFEAERDVIARALDFLFDGI